MSQKKEAEEYRGILADIEESPYFKAAPGEEKIAPLTVEAATELKWISEAVLREELADYEQRTGLKIDSISLKRDETEMIQKVEIKVCL